MTSPNQYINSWTEELTAQLRELVAAGRSSGQIGRELGFTRNAVVGKIHRLGLQLCFWGPQNRVKAAPKRRNKPPQLVVFRTYTAFKALPTGPVRVKKGIFRKQLQKDAPCQCNIHGLTKNKCHWPLWDDRNQSTSRRYYCGQRSIFGSSYCAKHDALSKPHPHINVEPSPALTAVSTPANSP
jgi:GcrA cell cycle regulator